jgi:hypothetical protein
MRRCVLAVALLAAILFASGSCVAQIKVPAETRNAALRYWMAMADLRDPPADAETQRLLENTAGGEAPWDETKLGPIVDANMLAIQQMQRATKLPECDWGLEYSRGAHASIGQLTRARVLARLNTLYGMRMRAKGQPQEAVDAWLDGVRFSQDLAKGGTVIFKLVARAALLSDFQALSNAARAGSLPSEQRTRVAVVIRSLPLDVFDWSEALGLEEAALETAVEEMRQSKNLAAVYQGLNGQPPPANFALPPLKEVIAFRALIVQAQAALRLPPSEARVQLEQLQTQIGRFGDFFERAIPSLVKINDARTEVESARASLLRTLAS